MWTNLASIWGHQSSALTIQADDSDEEALGMEDLGSSTPFKRHDPSNDNDAADAYGDEADLVV